MTKQTNKTVFRVTRHLDDSNVRVVVKDRYTPKGTWVRQMDTYTPKKRRG